MRCTRRKNEAAVVVPDINEMLIFSLLFLKGEDLADLLPNPEEILQEPQLSNLSGNDVFQFLLKAVYEHVHSLMEAQR